MNDEFDCIDDREVDFVENLITSYIPKLEEFDLFVEQNKNKGVMELPFPTLNEKLNGGLTSGVGVVAGMSGVGKTTFCLEIAIDLAKQGYRILFFSYEMTRNDLVAKILSYCCFDICMNKNSKYYVPNKEEYLINTTNFLYDDIKDEKLKKCVYDYANSFLNNFIIFEKKDIKQDVDIIIDGLCDFNEKAIVIIDYLQIMVNVHYLNNNIRIDIDNVINKFHNLAKTKNIFILFISSINRSSNFEEITYSSLKESGGIEFGVDYLFGLQLHSCSDKFITAKNRDILIKEYKSNIRQYPREIDLKILKARYSREEELVNFLFRPDYGYFYEK